MAACFNVLIGVDQVQLGICVMKDIKILFIMYVKAMNTSPIRLELL